MVDYSKVSEDREKLKFEDTNLANFGTELEYKLKKNAAQNEPAWKNTNKLKGLKIWRIEKFEVKEISNENYSKFYDGDSYIILHNKVEIVNNEEKITHRVFMWIGEYSTQDEYGTAAYKTVELDDYLDRKATLFREVQNHESNEFLDLFNHKIQILNGGISSGFIHVEKTDYDNYKGNLFHIKKNNNNYRINEVLLNSNSLNNDDCFILDKINKLYLFKGSRCSNFESFKAASLAKEIKDSRKSEKCCVIEIDNKDNAALNESNENVDNFWKCLNGKPEKIKDDEEGNEAISNNVDNVKVVKCSDESGSLSKTLIYSSSDNSNNKLEYDMLKSDDTFLVSDKDKVVYAWIGNKASFNEKNYAFILASEFIKDYNYPCNITISVINEGNESVNFKKLFC